MMSTSVGVSFLSSSFISLHSLANLAPSIWGDCFGLPPNAQNSRKVSSSERSAIIHTKIKSRLPAWGAWLGTARVGSSLRMRKVTYKTVVPVPFAQPQRFYCMCSWWCKAFGWDGTCHMVYTYFMATISKSLLQTLIRSVYAPALIHNIHITLNINKNPWCCKIVL